MILKHIYTINPIPNPVKMEVYVRNWFISPVHHKLCGDIPTGGGYVYSPEIKYKKVIKNKKIWKVVSYVLAVPEDPKSNVIYVLDPDYIDRYFVARHPDVANAFFTELIGKK